MLTDTSLQLCDCRALPLVKGPAGCNGYTLAGVEHRTECDPATPQARVQDDLSPARLSLEIFAG